MKRKICIFVISIFSLFLFSCGKYNPLLDKNIVPHFDFFDESEKFVFTVYYNNPDSYYDMPLNPYAVMDIQHEFARGDTLYKNELEIFLSEIFGKPPKIIKDFQKLHDKKNRIYTVCCIRNQFGKMILWFSYDDPDSNEPYMIMNGKLTEKNEKLANFAKVVLNSCYENFDDEN